MEKYRHREIEEKWRNAGMRPKLNQVDLWKAEKPFYNLIMFPQAIFTPKIIEDPKVKKWVEGKMIVKKIFVPNKLVNIVVK